MTPTQFLSERRSHPPKTLRDPAPSKDEIIALLTMAARVPDHGKLEPWRFVVPSRTARDRLKPRLAEAARAAGTDPAKIEKTLSSFDSPAVVVVIFSPKDSAKVPEWEQFLSAGAACLSLVNAALASGLGASWITGIAAEPEFATAAFDLAPGERVVGLIHIGQPSGPVPDRPRPDINAITRFID